MTDKPTIAILGGTGHEGTGLALRWASAGYEVIIGSRQKEKALKVLIDQGALKAEEKVPPPYLISPPKQAKIQDFASFMNEYLHIYSALREEPPNSKNS